MSEPDPCAVNVGALYDALPARPTDPISEVTHGDGNELAALVVTLIEDEYPEKFGTASFALTLNE